MKSRVVTIVVPELPPPPPPPPPIEVLIFILAPVLIGSGLMVEGV